MTTTAPSPLLHRGLWLTQGVVAVVFVGTAIWKLATPAQALAGMIPWAGDVSSTTLVLIALIDLLGGLGVILPSLTRIKPTVTVVAAIGCVLLMSAAIAFHLSRGELAATPFNVVMLLLSAFIAWGRLLAAPIAPR